MPESGSRTESGRAVGGPPFETPPGAHPASTVGAASGARPWWRPYLPALVVGGVCIIAGGLVAAVTGPLTLTHGSWAAAYLVLVAGAAQLALATGQATLQRWARHPVGWAWLLTEFAAWNLGNIAVVAGTFLGATWLVNLGGAILVVALGALLVATRNGFRDVKVTRRRALTLLAVRALVALLLVSIPIGLWLSHVRAS